MRVRGALGRGAWLGLAEVCGVAGVAPCRRVRRHRARCVCVPAWAVRPRVTGDAAVAASRVAEAALHYGAVWGSMFVIPLVTAADYPGWLSGGRGATPSV